MGTHRAHATEQVNKKRAQWRFEHGATYEVARAPEHMGLNLPVWGGESPLVCMPCLHAALNVRHMSPSERLEDFRLIKVEC